MHLKRKSKGNYRNSSSTPLHLYMDSNFTVTAFYSPIPPEIVSIELVSSPPEAGILFDDPSKRSWNTATDVINRELLATADPAYSFIGWSSQENISFDPSWKSPSAVISFFSELLGWTRRQEIDRLRFDRFVMVF